MKSKLYTVQKKTFKELKCMEKEPLRSCKGDGKITFTRPLVMLDKVTFDKNINVLERYCKGNTSYKFTKS